MQLARSSRHILDQATLVGICAGSGSSVLKDLLGTTPIDLFVTGECDHHTLLAANSQGVQVITMNHSNSERPWLHHFAPLLEETMNEGLEDRPYRVEVSEKDHDPLEFV